MGCIKAEARNIEEDLIQFDCVGRTKPSDRVVPVAEILEFVWTN